MGHASEHGDPAPDSATSPGTSPPPEPRQHQPRPPDEPSLRAAAPAPGRASRAGLTLWTWRGGSFCAATLSPRPGDSRGLVQVPRMPPPGPSPVTHLLFWSLQTPQFSEERRFLFQTQLSTEREQGGHGSPQSGQSCSSTGGRRLPRRRGPRAAWT